MTPDKYHPRRNISDILYTPTNSVSPLRKDSIYPKKGTTPHYKVSDDTNTDHSHGYKWTKHNEDKEESSNISKEDLSAKNKESLSNIEDEYSSEESKYPTFNVPAFS